MAISMVEDTIDELGEINLSPENEKQTIGRLMADAQSQPKEGNMYFIISSRWFSAWENYTGVGVDDPLRQTHFQLSSKNVNGRPTSIDNSDIIENKYDELLDISKALLERRDYVLVPQTVWEKLLKWYGGGPTLPRKMISQGSFHKKQYVVEVYPLRLKLIDSKDNSETIIRLSRKATLDELYDAVCTLKRVDKTMVSIWDYFNKRKQNELSLANASKTLEKSDVQMDQDILLEPKTSKYEFEKELPLVPVAPFRSSISIAGGAMVPSTSASSENGSDSAKSIEVRGLAGLQNLGNTCFMNSAIQCLVHTGPLAEYFLQDYSDEINSHNPLGMNGKLALAFGELLRKLWSAGGNVIVPRVFKGKLSQFAPQFSGYNQHDSQELLAFLLDGLHEDLNRVKRKPYMEMKDWSGCPDDQVAQEFWNYHKARNDSIIVDVFQGQYKSTLVCPVCAKISITFDPFMYLSLPLPSMVIRSITLTIFYGDGTGLPMPYTVSVLKHGTCGDLKQALGVACCLRSEEILLLAEVYDHNIHRFLEDPLEHLSSIKDEDYLVAYRLPLKADGKPRLEVAHKEKPLVESAKYQSKKFFGAPLVSYLEDEVATGTNIEAAVCKILSPLRKTSSAESLVEEDAKSMLRLYVSDERYSSDKVIANDWVVNCGNRVRVEMEWSEREKKVYDHSYLNDLPMVYRKASFSAKKTRQESVSLFSCLEAFLKEEPLGPNDMWYCPGCKQHRQASKKLDLWMLPDILVFHLKRFSYSRFFKNKLDTFVDFPIRNLDLTDYVRHSPQLSFAYDLYAVSCHYGSLGGGHYTAYSKLIDDDKWYNFDDSRVTNASESDIRTSAAYVLFYQRVKL